MADKKIQDLVDELSLKHRKVGAPFKVEGSAADTKITGVEIWKIPSLDIDNDYGNLLGITILVQDAGLETEAAWFTQQNKEGPIRNEDIDISIAPYRTALLDSDENIKLIVQESFNTELKYYTATTKKLISGNNFETITYSVWKQDSEIETYTVGE